MGVCVSCNYVLTSETVKSNQHVLGGICWTSAQTSNIQVLVPVSSHAVKRMDSVASTTRSSIIEIVGDFSFGYTALGTGTCATVYAGFNTSTFETVAVKVMSGAWCKKGAAQRHFDKEVQCLDRLNKHPNIMELYGFQKEESRLLLFLEYCSGRSLYDRILERKKYDEVEAPSIMRQLIEAVLYMHSQGVIHRDLKPENILFKAPNCNQVVIADFGYATFCDVGDMLEEQLGTPNYVAPEMLMRCGYNHSVDIWALGVILYVMLSGRFPFCNTKDKDITVLFNSIINGKFSFPLHKFETVSAAAKDLISKVLVVEVATRLTAEGI